VPRRRLTGIGIGTPVASANASWEYTEPPEPGHLVTADGRPPKVQQITDPILIGVQPSSAVPAGSRGPSGETLLERVPAYMRREVDAELRDRLLAGSTFVLVVGDSSAGKSRTAFEAVTGLPAYALIVPNGRSALGAAVTRALEEPACVLWLDDLEVYLGPEGLTRASVTRLLADTRAHRVIVATLRAAEEARLTSEAAAGDGGRQLSREARDVLSLSHRIRLPRMFSPAELTNARRQSWDPRIADAVAHADAYGPGEYLAAGPELLREWEDASSPNTDPQAPTHPRAAALISAAIDIRRGGYVSPLPRSLLTTAHDYYLQGAGRSWLNPESVEDAWAWATMPRRSTTAALLQVVDDDHVQVFDYLLDSVQRRNQPGSHAPEHILALATAHSPPADAMSIADTAYYYGQYELAEASSLRAYQLLEASRGPEDAETLSSRAFHANVLRQLERQADAFAEHAAIEEIAARVHGPSHPITLRARTGRAFALIGLERAQEAEAELRAVQEISSQTLGPDHDVTLTSRHLRAIALSRLGQLAEAEAENRFILETRTREFGGDHHLTVLSRGNLAAVLYSADKLDEAERQARAVADIRTKILGPEHLETLYSRAFHADVLRELGRPAETEAIYREVIAVAAHVYGPEHSRVLSSRTGRALALIRLGRDDEAEAELRDVLATSSRTMGPEHYTTLNSRRLRSVALHHLGRLDEAESENRIVLAAWTTKYGPQDASTLYCRTNLAAILYQAGRIEEALDHADSVLDIRTRILGPEHRNTAFIRALRTDIEAAAHETGGPGSQVRM
jgi:tetratricopeptide (TPR) repeat protein